MISSTILWFKTINITKKNFLFLFLLLGTNVVVYIIAPISFANIISSATSQNNQLAILWIIINFLLQVLTIITTQIQLSLLKKIEQHIMSNLNKTLTPNNTNLILPTFKNISGYIVPLTNFLTSIIKMISIVIISGIYSIKLMLFIALTLTLCSITAATIEKKKHKSTNKLQYIPELMWLICTLLIMLSLINSISNQKITLTVFLLITTYINTHLTKPAFNLKIVSHSSTLKNDLETYNKFKNLK